MTMLFEEQAFAMLAHIGITPVAVECTAPVQVAACAGPNLELDIMQVLPKKWSSSMIATGSDGFSQSFMLLSIYIAQRLLMPMILVQRGSSIERTARLCCFIGIARPGLICVTKVSQSVHWDCAWL